MHLMRSLKEALVLQFSRPIVIKFCFYDGCVTAMAQLKGMTIHTAYAAVEGQRVSDAFTASDTACTAVRVWCQHYYPRRRRKYHWNSHLVAINDWRVSQAPRLRLVQ